MEIPQQARKPEGGSREQTDLRSALEYQIDIVLRLEEERLLLLRENKLQKDKIRDLTVKTNTLESKNNLLKEPKETQTPLPILVESDTQTDQTPQESVDLDSSTRKDTLRETERSGNSLLDEAAEYVKKYSNLNDSQASILCSNTKKKAFQGKTTQRSARSTATDKENMSMSINEHDDHHRKSFAFENIKQEKNVLTEELIALNKEISKLKTENRLLNENVKKSDKEKNELKKSVQTKSDLVDKLKKENSDMVGIINKDQFKTVRNIEGELKKVVGHNRELIIELQNTQSEKNRLENELREFKGQLDKLTEDIEQKFKEERETEQLKKEKERYEEKIRSMETAMNLRQEELLTKEQTIQEMIADNGKLSNDIDYFKNVALTSKSFAEKAIADVEVYRKMLETAQKSQ